MQVAKLYGRLAEMTLYLEKDVGVCCHSACSDCEWRLPDGGYRFDILKSTGACIACCPASCYATPSYARLRCAAPKWLPCYFARDFEDERGCHVPAWSSALFPDGAESSVSRTEFDERFRAMEYASAMGPKGIIKPDQSDPSEEAVDLFWEYLVDGSESSDSLDGATWLRRLQDMSPDENRAGLVGEGPDFLDWKAFAKGLGAKPFDRW